MHPCVEPPVNQVFYILPWEKIIPTYWFPYDVSHLLLVAGALHFAKIPYSFKSNGF
jgi:hypothetical protein